MHGKKLEFFDIPVEKNLRPFAGINGKKCLKFLNFRYGKFVESYVGYLELYDDAEQPLRKTQQYRALTLLDMNAQEKYKQTCFLLHLWDLNVKARTLPRSETVRAVRSLSSHDGAFHLFRDYLATIRTAIFDKSRLIKKPFGELFMDKRSHTVIIDQINGFQNELHALASTIDLYRHFLVQTSSNHKSQWGISWLFGTQENKHTRALTGLVKESEQLNNLCKQFKGALEQEDFVTSKLTHELEHEISHHLHEMGQPLASGNDDEEACKSCSSRFAKDRKVRQFSYW